MTDLRQRNGHRDEKGNSWRCQGTNSKPWFSATTSQPRGKQLSLHPQHSRVHGMALNQGFEFVLWQRHEFPFSSRPWPFRCRRSVIVPVCNVPVDIGLDRGCAVIVADGECNGHRVFDPGQIGALRLRLEGVSQTQRKKNVLVSSKGSWLAAKAWGE
jgi:hypothetical protein